jgi:hypothetical protein
MHARLSLGSEVEVREPTPVTCMFHPYRTRGQWGELFLVHAALRFLWPVDLLIIFISIILMYLLVFSSIALQRAAPTAGTRSLV